MPRIRTPRQGSMQYWPRKRAADIVAHIRTWPQSKDTKLLGFCAYKVGMTHVLANDNRFTSITKGEDIMLPVTILECPPLKVAAVLLYKKDAYGTHCIGQITSDKLDKELSRRLPLPKEAPKPQPDTKNLSEVRVLCYSQPKMVSIGKKTPEVFELGIGGAKTEDQLNFAKGLLGKEVKVTDVFTQGQLVDSVSITKGKGLQGPVNRFAF